MKSKTKFLMIMLLAVSAYAGHAAQKPNVILIVCDDLNDYVEPLAGHPQVKTPHITRLAEGGVRFAAQLAHTAASRGPTSRGEIVEPMN